MTEYENLNHMTKVEDDDLNQTFYFPHHAVREFSSTTKVRVVFDGSCKTDSGLSFNDVQMTGPTLQNDLFSILIRFRKHAIVITADIVKMYRQVLVNPSQRRLQRIFWRTCPKNKVQCFELNTVTYGTRSGPFLAVRSMHQAAYDNRITYPLASKTILEDFYMDDMLSGANNIK